MDGHPMQSRAKNSRSLTVAIMLATLALMVLSTAEEAGAGTSIGAIGGITRSTFGGDTPEKGKYESITGFAFGGICEVDISDNVRISLQPSFVQKGSKVAYEVEGQKERVDSVDVRIDYFTVPVLVKVMTGGGRFYVSGGLEAGFPLSAEHETSSATTDIKDALQSVDFAADFGIGLHVPMGRPVMYFELRYTQSLLNIFDEEWAQEELGLQPRVKNHGTQFYVGLLYEL